jgi:hypothetical protein
VNPLSTTIQPDIQPADSEAQIVDVLIPALVLDVALARLPIVQGAERRAHGKASTNLSTLAVEILTSWKPGDTERPPQPKEAECPTCHRTVSTYPTGKLRVHGRPGQRCPEAYVQDARGKSDTRPLRFPMNRAVYEAVRDRIHFNGQSVANVISQRLTHFARTGHL